MTKPESFNPDQIVVEKDQRGEAFHIKGVHAVKEHRITLSLDEVPSASLLSMYLPLSCNIIPSSLQEPANFSSSSTNFTFAGLLTRHTQ